LNRQRLFFQGVLSQVFQALIVRELIVRFGGSEYVLLAVLFFSLLSTGLGCLLEPKLLKPIPTGILLLSSITCACLSLYLISISHLDIHSALDTTPATVLWFCVIGVVPFCLINGALYSRLSFNTQTSYAQDALGDIVGGLLFVFTLVSFHPSTIVISTSLCIAFGFFYKNKITLSLALIIFLVLLITEKPLNKSSHLETNSGRIQILNHGEDKSIWLNRNFLANTSIELYDQQEKFLFSVLSQGNKLDKVLFIGFPIDPILPKLAQLNHIQIDIIVNDSSIIPSAKKYLKPYPEKIKIHLDSYISFIQNTKQAYDLICLFPGQPDNFATNRFYTSQFISLLKKILNPKGTLVFNMKSFNGYGHQSITQYNSVFLNTIKEHFHNITLGKGTLKLVSAQNIKSPNPKDKLAKQLKAHGFEPTLFEQIVDKNLSKLEKHQIFATKTKSNSIYYPILPVYKLIRDIQEGLNSNWANRVVGNLLMMILDWGILVGLFVCMLSLKSICTNKVNGIWYSFQTGFFGMSIFVVLIILFQSILGCIYQDVALISSIFIAGTALGSLNKIKIRWLFSGTVIVLALSSNQSLPFWLTLFFASGYFSGLRFYIVSKKYHQSDKFWALEIIGSAIAIHFVFSAIFHINILWILAICGFCQLSGLKLLNQTS
jgi:spermidine synthase